MKLLIVKAMTYLITYRHREGGTIVAIPHEFKIV